MKIHVTSICNKFTIVALLVALIGSAVQVTPVYAASIVVNTNADNEANDGKCTLREAINAANVNARSGTLAGECVAGSTTGMDSITFAGNYMIDVGSGGTPLKQLPYVTSPITITGKGAANTVLRAFDPSNPTTWRIFQVTAVPLGNLTLDGVTLQNGLCNGSCTVIANPPIDPNAGGAIHNSGTVTVKNSIIKGNQGILGGGIYNNFGTLNIVNSTFQENHAFQKTGVDDGGGAIYNSGTLTLTNSTFSGNSAQKNGGAIFNSSSGTATVTNSTIASNTGVLGGGIFNSVGTLAVINSQILSNKALQSGGDDGGGGIRNTGTLTVTNSTFSGNTAPGGSGILNFLHLTVKDSTFSGNQADYGAGILNGIYNCPNCLNDTTIENTVFKDNTGNIQAGAIYSHLGSTVTVKDSTFLNNTAPGGGGAIVNFGANLTITGSTFSNNASNRGGGIYNSSGPLTVANSTFSGNSASDKGGGLLNFEGGTSTVTNSTFAGNSAPNGGGIRNENTTTLRNTIVVNSPSGGNCSASSTITDGGNNLQFGGTVANSCGASIPTSDPLLGSLANNGGHTKTMALLPGSPAIDAGSDAICAAAIGSPNYGAGGKDQRGGARPQGSHCDIGAYESGAPVTFISGFSDVPDNYWALVFIERLFEAGITGGCSTSPLQYCPEGTVTRAQMAIFLERGIHGSSYNPPAVGGSTGFNDVPLAYWAGAWIKQLAADGITGGCGSGSYCPEGAVTRAQMAVFLLRSEHGAGYNPPDAGASTGFSDVPPSYWAAAWIKQLVAEGITAGCGTGTYCPESSVTRAQMAVFLVRTFNLP